MRSCLKNKQIRHGGTCLRTVSRVNKESNRQKPRHGQRLGLQVRRTGCWFPASIWKGLSTCPLMPLFLPIKYSLVGKSAALMAQIRHADVSSLALPVPVTSDISCFLIRASGDSVNITALVVLLPITPQRPTPSFLPLLGSFPKA